MSEDRPDYPKQVILVRQDIKMPAGKILSQVCHASMAAILDVMHAASTNSTYTTTLVLDLEQPTDQAIHEWLTGSFTKVVVGVPSDIEMEDIYARAKALGIPCSRIVDNGRTVFHGEPTLTCAAIGPAMGSVLDPLTGHLKLLNKV